MQAVAQETTITQSKGVMAVSIRYEWLIVMALVIFSGIFHLAGLDEVPLSDAEAYQALSAWRSTMPNVVGEPLLADSPIVWWSQKIAFSLLGGSEFSSRVLTALAGVAVSLSPLFFVPILGKGRAYIMTMLLCASPILLATARMSSGTTWSLLLAVILLWCAWRFYETSQKRYALSGIIALGFLIFTAEPQAILLALVLIGAGVIALSLTVYASFIDESPTDSIAQLRTRLSNFSMIEALSMTGLILFATVTGFMFAPDGLKIVGELLRQFFTGFSLSQNPLAYRPLDVLVFYEIWLIPFFFVGLGFVIYQHRMSFIERFLIFWTVLGLLAFIFYPDMKPSHAAWLVLPMSAMMALVISQAFVRVSSPIDAPVLVTDDRGLLWGKFTVAVMTFMMFILLTAHLQFLSRSFLLFANGAPSTFFANLDSVEIARQIQVRRYIGIREAMIVSVIVSVMMLIGYFLATTIWGAIVPLQGALIGMFAFVCMASFGTAWGVAMHRASNPIEMLYYPQATSSQAMLLRETMHELAFRYSGGTNSLPIAILAPSDGIVAWLLRDFYNAKFVSSIREAQLYEVIIVPFADYSSDYVLDLGGSYVGQRFNITDEWAGMSGFVSIWRLANDPAQVLRAPYRSLIWEINLDLMSWWFLREVRSQPNSVHAVLLWVRQDVFDNVPLLNASGR